MAARKAPPPSRRFSDVLKGGMKEHRLKQIDVARELGVTQSRVSRWSSQRGLPNDENLRELARLLMRDYDELKALVDVDRAELFGPIDSRSTLDRIDELEGAIREMLGMLRVLLARTEGLSPDDPANGGSRGGGRQSPVRRSPSGGRENRP